MLCVFSSESAVIQIPAYPSSTALVSVGARSDYLESSAHCDAIARRIVAALRDGRRPLVLVTGDPPADPQALSEALGKVAGRRYAVTIISCGPELRREDLERQVPTLAKPTAIGGAAAEPGCSAPAVATIPLRRFRPAFGQADRGRL